MLWMEEDESESKDKGEDMTEKCVQLVGFREDLDLCETQSK